MPNGIMQKIDAFFGVNPPSLKRRLTIGSIAIAIVIITLIITIAGTNITLGGKTFINSFLAFLTGAPQPVLQEQPFSVKRIVYFMAIISIAFFLSIIYYIILPWKKPEQKEETFLELGRKIA